MLSVCVCVNIIKIKTYSLQQKTTITKKEINRS